jgi:hypothetical protein
MLNVFQNSSGGGGGCEPYSAAQNSETNAAFAVEPRKCIKALIELRPLQFMGIVLNNPVGHSENTSRRRNPLSSGCVRREVWQNATYVSERSSLSIFSVEKSPGSFGKLVAFYQNARCHSHHRENPEMSYGATVTKH